MDGRGLRFDHGAGDLGSRQRLSGSLSAGSRQHQQAVDVDNRQP